MRQFFSILIIFLTLSFSSLLQAEERNLSSYHPSPFGFFDQLRLIPQTVPPVCNAANKGVIYYDEAEGKLMTCGGSGVRLIAVWDQDGLQAFPADDSSAIHWGIGDQTPDAFLEISASGAAHHLLMLSSDDANDGDVFTVRNNGRVGIGTAVPDFRLSIDEDKLGSGNADGGILSYGTLGSGATMRGFNPSLFQRPTFIWYPRTASLYARRMSDTSGLTYNQFNYAFGENTEAEGYASFASGENVTANFINTFASGLNNSAGNNYAFASGTSVVASGEYSVATGNNTVASGFASVAMGAKSVASGISAVSLGSSTQATGDYSLALGGGCIASGIASVSSGLTGGAATNEAQGDYSVAIGHGNLASGEAAIAFGQRTIASGNASFASNQSSQAVGDYSFAVGQEVRANAYAQTVLGTYNIPDDGVSATSWVATDPLFVVGSGTGNTAQGNALTILKNGNVGINTTNPGSYKLRVVGGDASVDAANAWLTLSDKRLKKNVQNLGPTLESINQLTGITYYALEEEKDTKRHIGLIAQEVEVFFPSLVVTDTASEEKYKSLAYGRISPLMIEAVKELDAQNNTLNQKVEKVQGKLRQLKKLKNEEFNQNKDN